AAGARRGWRSVGPPAWTSGPPAVCVASQPSSGSPGISGTGPVTVGSSPGGGSSASPSPSAGSWVHSSPSSGAIRSAEAGEGPTCFPQTSQSQPATGASQTGQGRTLGASGREGRRRHRNEPDGDESLGLQLSIGA